jgi:response regulator of citrate/malate metabolism
MDKHRHPLKILTIDDEEQIQHALQDVFQYQGWEALSAGSVPEGLQMFHQHRPDLVLMAYHLPGLDGAKGMALLRAEDPDIPLIGFTVSDDQQIANAFWAAGASDFVLKPVKMLDIIARIKLHIQLLEYRHDSHPAIGEPVKGIGATTLALLEDCLTEATECLTVSEIAQRTGLAYQTSYRYLQYMVSVGQVEVSMRYGKVGRPKQRYRLIHRSSHPH